MPNFSALHTGLSGLMAHRQAAEVISHNIANVNTEGYSRRRVDLQAEGRAAVTSVWGGVLDTGDGVRSLGVQRIQDLFLEAQHRSETGIGAQLTGQAAVIQRLEGAFPEPSDTGIASALDEFWASWQAIVNNPESMATRSAVLENASLAIQALQLADRQIRTQHNDAVTNVRLMADEVNRIAEEVVRYNAGIRSAVVLGQQPNDLYDQRDVLLLRLSELAGATVQEGEHGQVAVFVGGRALVHGANVEPLQVTVDDPAQAGGLPTVRLHWKDGYEARLTGGSIAGYQDGANTVLPDYLGDLDDVARTLVDTVNAQHKLGRGLNDPPMPGDPDADPPVPAGAQRAFFSEDPAHLTAATIRLSADVAGKPQNVAAASATGGALDTSNATALADIGSWTGDREGRIGADAKYRSMIVKLGGAVQFQTQQADAQQAVVRRIDEDRKSVSGVNLDEEMVNLVAAQHAYAAAARVVTTIDEMLDVLINRTGVVGR